MATQTSPAATPKSVFASKTFWLNVLAVAASAAAPQVAAANPHVAVAAVGIANLILRLFTSQPVTFGGYSK